MVSARMPEVRFAYTDAGPPGTVREVQNQHGRPAVLDGSAQQWIDLDGSALPGLLIRDPGGSLRYRANLGGRLALGVSHADSGTSAEQPTAAHEDRDLQRQRHQRTPAGPASLARRGRAGRRLPAGTEGPDERFPEAAIRDAGYDAIWHGQKSWNGVAILARGEAPIETRRGCRAILDDTHSRYIEAAVNGVLIGCLYLPNGNPAPGPKFDYKLRWFERLPRMPPNCCRPDAPVVLAGDYNVMPTELDVYKPERWVDDALFRPEVRAAFRDLVAQGWTDAFRTLHPDEQIYTFWDYFRNALGRDAGLRIDHLCSARGRRRLVAAGVDREVRGARIAHHQASPATATG